MDVGQTKLLCLICGVEGENEFFSRVEFCAMTHHRIKRRALIKGGLKNSS